MEISFRAGYDINSNYFKRLVDKIPECMDKTIHYTLPGRKYSSTTKYPCIDCAIYQLNIPLGAKIDIEIYRYQKFVLLALLYDSFTTSITRTIDTLYP